MRGSVIEGRYQILDHVAANATGAIWLANDRRTGREVELWVANLGASAALLDEAQRIARHHHPGLPRILQVATHANHQLVVAERMVGQTLAARLAQATRSSGLGPEEATEILIEIAETLVVVERLELPHDVITPERVILTADGRVTLSNTGLIRAERQISTDSPYASDRTTDLRTRDRYALGVIAFEMLTGSVPVPWLPIDAQLAKLPDSYARLREVIASLVSGEPLELDLLVSSLRVARTGLRSLSVVIAEADRGARDLLALAVRQVSPGATLRFCVDCRALRSLFSTQPPEVVFFDPELPRLDLRELDTLARTRSVRLCSTRGPAANRAPMLAQFPSIEITPQVPRSELIAQLRAILLPGPRRARPEATPSDPIAGPGARPPAPAVPTPVAPAPAAPTLAIPAPAAPTLAAPATDSDATKKKVTRQMVRSTTPSPRPLERGAVIAKRYVIQGQLGAGGMGNVFEVRHLDLGKRFALKVLNPALVKNDEARERFLEEAKLASQLSHPNIVSVVDFGQDPDHGVFLVMELLTGDTLTRLAGKMSIRKTCETLGQIAEALDVLHREGIVHGDVKSDNVMMVEEQVGPRRRTIARLIDFGLAHQISSTGAGSHQICGTPEYLAPERIEGGPPSVSGDIYALGVIGYELLAGNVPFQGRVADDLEAHLMSEVPPIAPQRGQPVDEEVLTLLARAMHKDPAARHSTVSAFRYELNTVMNMLGMRKRSPSRRGRATPNALFDESRLAQAVITTGGEIAVANAAFRTLVPDLEQLVFDGGTLVESISRALEAGAPISDTARQGSTSLWVLISPVVDGAHVVISAPP